MTLTGFIQFDTYNLILTYLGVAIWIAVVLPRLLSRRLLTAPIVYLVLATVVFALLSESPFPHLGDEPYFGKRLTELGVIVSLTGAGLKLRQPFARRTWKHSWRLLVITMPLTIAGVALMGWSMLGFAPATALLLGAVIAPTDPVLASDIQTTPPDQEDHSETKLALTTEAGLNDGLAFPFTNMAIAMATVGIAPALWLNDWLLVDVLYKIVVGTLVGIGSGWLMAKVIFKITPAKGVDHFLTVGLLSLSLTLLPYGLAEILGGYGFITVFVAAAVFRHIESKFQHLTYLHDFSQELEKILVVILFTFAGIYLSQHFLDNFEWYMIPAALVILLLIRPVSGMIGLLGSSLPTAKRGIVSFFGIRGIGSIYYLLYAFYHTDFPQHNEALALVVTVIVLSIFMHGLLARPVMQKWDPLPRKITD